MTTTAQPPRGRASEPGALSRADGIELLGNMHGSGYAAGAALVRRADGQVVQLGPLMFALLESIDGKRSIPEIARDLSKRLGRECDDVAVRRLAEKLAAQGLLAGSEHNAPPRRNPLLALRWRVLITDPKWTARLTRPFTFLFEPWLMWPIVACFVGVLWLVLFHKGLAAPTADAFRRPGLLVLVFALTVASAGFHELGHAAACRRGGATPAGMGVGLYMVWPAFYTDVTDAYRLPRKDRLRVDLGGVYFNVIVAVVTTGVWLLIHVDALLLLVALQLLMMVKNLSPVIRSDGYHILADATGVPDLYAHIGPTLRRLLPWRRAEPSALTGRARALVTAWVLIVVPVLLSLMLGAVLLLPRLLATAWDSGRAIASGLPHEIAHGYVLAGLAALLRLVALCLPVAGSILVAQRLVRMAVVKANSWSEGHVVRRFAVVAAASAVACGAAYAWWPAGQYDAVRPADAGTLGGFATLVSQPVAAVRPPAAATGPVRLAPGTQLAVALVPTGGATKAHPALFVLPAKNHGDQPVAILASSTPDPSSTATPTLVTPASSSTPSTAPSTTTSSPPTQTPTQSATAFPFVLPPAPKPGDSQALALGKRSGGITYDVVYSLVTVKDGSAVKNRNTAYALASCQACTTVAVSFQLVLVVGRSSVITPINAAVAINKQCPRCLTVAIADQIVATLKSAPSAELVHQLSAELAKLGAIEKLGSHPSPAGIAAEVAAVQTQIEDQLTESGLLAHPIGTTTAATTTSGTTSAETTTTSAPTTTTTSTAPTSSTTTAPATTPAATTTTTATTSSTSATTTAETTTAETTTTVPTTTATTTTATTTDETTTG